MTVARLPSRPVREAAPRRALRRRSKRAAVLIVALMVAALIAVGLGSYLNLNLASSRLAKRSFNTYAALNLAEAGTEEAVWSFNRTQGGDTTAWSNWSTGTGSAAWRKFENFDFGQNSTGWVKVYVDNHAPGPTARPKIVSQSSTGAPGEAANVRMIEVTLRRRSLFAGGLVAKESIAFSGANASVDSWNSDPDHNPSTAAVPYSASVRTDNGTIASGSVVNTAVLINQANVWGYVATGGSQPQVGSSGTIRGASTPENIAVDPNRISTDFSASLEHVLAPVDGTILASLPATLGTAGLSTRWRTPNIALSGNQTLTILGEVTLTLTAATNVDAVSVTGNASIIVPDGSKLTLYVEGHVKIGGNGMANGNVQALACQIYGISQSPGGQDIDIVGNGALKCAIYAPNGNVKIAGNGDVMGSVIANKITLVGNAAFHYDESLADRGADQPFAISKWRELTTAAERAQYAPLFQGW
jgi:hypothetical protein